MVAVPLVDAPSVMVYGAPWCLHCTRVKKFLAAHRVPYKHVDIDEHPEAIERLKALQGGKQVIPTVVYGEGIHEVNPSNEVLAGRIGLQPNSAFLGDALERDTAGFLVTSATMETSMAGVFDAGDVRSGSTKQLGSAVGDGIAALLVTRRYLEAHRHKAVAHVDS